MKNRYLMILYIFLVLSKNLSAVTLCEWTNKSLRVLPEYTKGELPFKDQRVINGKEITESLGNLLGRFKNSHDNFRNDALWLDKDPKSFNNLFDFDIEKKGQWIHPFVQKIKVEAGTKLCFFGDIHGSMHSSLRNYWNLTLLEYIDNNFKIIKPNCYIIFLGDLSDRGRWSIETWDLAIQLKMANWDKVIILRGNHEETVSKSFYDKLKVKYPRDNLYDQLSNQLSHIFELSPLTLFIECNDYFIQCCHGGIDPLYDPENFLRDPTKKYARIKNDLFEQQKEEYYAIDKQQSQEIEEATNRLIGDEKEFELLEIKEQEKVLENIGKMSKKLENEYKDKKIAKLNQIAENCTIIEQSIEAIRAKLGSPLYDFLWCDFYHEDINKVEWNPERGSQIYLNRLDTLFKNLFLNEKIKAIIRGHQHFDFGLKLLSKLAKELKHWEDVVTIQEKEEAKFKIGNYIPILTFSTAPEGVGSTERPMNYDCFGILTTAEKFEDCYMEVFETMLPPDRNGKFLSIKKITTAGGKHVIGMEYSQESKDIVIDPELVEIAQRNVKIFVERKQSTFEWFTSTIKMTFNTTMKKIRAWKSTFGNKK